MDCCFLVIFDFVCLSLSLCVWISRRYWYRFWKVHISCFAFDIGNIGCQKTYEHVFTTYWDRLDRVEVEWRWGFHCWNRAWYFISNIISREYCSVNIIFPRSNIYVALLNKYKPSISFNKTLSSNWKEPLQHTS